MSERSFIGLCLAVLCLAVAIVVVNIKLERLQHRVDCLQHPHAESSIAGVFKNGKFHVTQPAHKTGC